MLGPEQSAGWDREGPGPMADPVSQISGASGKWPFFARLAQWSLALVILGWLGYQASQFDGTGWQHLAGNEISWTLLFLATAVYFSAIVLSFIRWRVLVTVLGIPLTLRGAIELGFLGYLTQFFSLGAVGGDIFKVLFLVRQHPQHAPAAVASVIVDRVVGLYAMILFGYAVFTAAQWSSPLPASLAQVPNIFLLLSALGGIVIWLLLRTRLELARMLFRFRSLRRLIPLAARLDSGLRRYRTHAAAVGIAIGLGIVGHVLFAVSLLLTSIALTDRHPGWFAQLSIWPLAGSAGALPITPGGLGTFDAAYVYLYDRFAKLAGGPSVGVVVTLVYRLMCLATAAIGTVVYFARSRGTPRPDSPSISVH